MKNSFQSTPRYVASPELVATVNLAIDLEKPLLLKGEPGTGKTCLAEAISESLGCQLIHWPVKSTTKAADGLYSYDTLSRLNDARFGDGDVNDIRQYIKMGPLGEAFRSSERVIVLIDEIDKADIEFPNDLLHELDRMTFTVNETGDTISAEHRPIIILTSNNEKELPDAFLRRCIFHWIAFPEEELMRSIVAIHEPQLESKLLDACLKKFYWLREQPMVRKRPSTSELVDWIRALKIGGVRVETLHDELPFIGTLLKREQDIDALKKPRWRT